MLRHEEWKNRDDTDKIKEEFYFLNKDLANQ